MNSSSVIRIPVFLVAMAVILAACGSQSPGGAESTATESRTPAPEGSEAASAEPTERTGPPEGQASEFIIPLAGVGISTVPLLAAVDELTAQGYTVETPEVSGYELATEGVAQERFHFSAGVTGANLQAIEQGAPLAIIGSRVGNEFLLYAREGLDSCEEIMASRVAIHSPGSSSGLMMRSWAEENCPEGTPWEPLIIEGSQNRLAAMLADQLDASPVDFASAFILDDEGGFERVVVFKDALEGVNTSTIAGNVDWMAENPDVTRDFLRELILQHRRINSEDGYLFELYERYLPEEVEADPETAQLIVNEYVDLQLFDNNLDLDQAAVERTLEYYGPSGTAEVETEQTADEVADLSYLEDVLDELGRE